MADGVLAFHVTPVVLNSMVLRGLVRTASSSSDASTDGVLKAGSRAVATRLLVVP